MRAGLRPGLSVIMRSHKMFEVAKDRLLLQQGSHNYTPGASQWKSIEAAFNSCAPYNFIGHSHCPVKQRPPVVLSSQLISYEL